MRAIIPEDSSEKDIGLMVKQLSHCWSEMLGIVVVWMGNVMLCNLSRRAVQTGNGTWRGVNSRAEPYYWRLEKRDFAGPATATPNHTWFSVSHVISYEVRYRKSGVGWQPWGDEVASI
jgi:hypothetical protein